jgi:hypothetical protein
MLVSDMRSEYSYRLLVCIDNIPVYKAAAQVLLADFPTIVRSIDRRRMR